MQTLVVDIGNTSTSIGVCCAGSVRSVQRAPSIAPALQLKEVPSRAVIASVKPSVNDGWQAFLERQGVRDFLWVSPELHFGIPLGYPEPETLGADRLANACEAAAVWSAPVVVCDFGTALTFDVVREQEGYVGGIICPGLPLMFDYLSEKTDLLPRIQPEKMAQVIGTNTADAMRIGASVGYRGMVREILGELGRELGASLKVCATGGFAAWVLRDLDDSIAVDPLLTLKGLGRIGALNR